MELSAEEALHYYKLIAENANDLIRVVDNRFKIEYINEMAHFQILGYHKDELIGKIGRIPIHPEDYSEARRFLYKVFKTGQAMRTGRIQHKNGNWIWVEIKGKAFKDKHGNKKAIMISRELTDRIQIEMKLKRERERAELYLNLVGVILVAINKEGKISLMNKKGYEALEYEEGELIGKNWFETCLPSSLKDQVHEIFKQLISGDVESVEYFENPIITKNGKEKIIAWHNTVLYDDEGNISGTLSSGEDITERKKAEQKLCESEERYRLLFEQSPQQIILLDSSGTILGVNTPLLVFFGHEREELIGKDFRKFKKTTPENLILFKKIFQEALTRGFFEPFQFLAYNRNDEGKWMEIRASSIDIENQKIIQIILQDIDDLKMAEEELKSERDKLKAIIDGLTSAGLGIDIIGKDYKVQYMNETMKERFGDFIGKLCYENYMESKEPCEECSVIKSIENNTVERVDQTGGDNRDYEIFSAPIPNADGTIDKAIELIIDITERKESEQELMESEEKFRTIAEQSLMGICIVHDNKIKYINKKYADIWGYSIEEMKEWEFKDTANAIYPEDKVFILEQFAKKQRGDPDVDSYYAYRGFKKTGEIIWVDQYSKTINYKGKPADLITLLDITERKRAEQKLKESEERYRYLFEQSPNNILLVDYDGTFLSVNTQFLSKFGFKREELVGKTFTEIEKFGAKNVLLFTKVLKDSLAKGVFEPFEFQAYDKNDEIRWMELRASSIEIDDNKMIQVIIQDIDDRKRADLALKESEEKYRKLFETMTEGVILINKDGKITEANPAAEHILGLTRPEIEGENYFDPEWNFIRPDGTQMPRSEGAITRAIKEKIIVENVIEGIKRPSKRILWLNISAAPLIEATGEFYCVVATFSDITELKETQENLKESEERYRHLFEHSPDEIALLDPDGMIIDANSPFLNYFGFNREELLGKHYTEIDTYFPPENLIFYEKMFQKVLEKGFFEPVEFQVYDKNNEPKWMEIRASVIDINNKKIVQVIFQDIDERKRAELALKESEEKFRTIAEQSLIGIAIVQDNVVKYLNEQFAEILGYSIEEILKWTPNEFLKTAHPDDREFISDQATKKQEGSKDYLPHYEFRSIKKTGEVIWIDNYTRSISYGGRTADMVAFIDITEKKKIEEELIKLNTLKSELLTRSSHELKTPLMSIKGFTELLLLKYNDVLNDEESFLINEIRKGCTRLETLIKDILKTADLESDSVIIEKSENDLAKLIRTCINDLKGLADLRNHTINLMLHDKLITHFEKKQIRQAFNNILNNAIKYTPPYGKMDIKSQIDKNFIIISIKDSGIGLMEEEKEQLFKQFGKIERFGQGFDVITEGSGLGLYISKKIVELHGGDVWVESEGRNKGSTFYLSLPIISN